MCIRARFLNAESSRLALETGTSCIRFLGWFYLLIGLKMATDGVLRGAGDMGAFTAANLVNLTPVSYTHLGWPATRALLRSSRERKESSVRMVCTVAPSCSKRYFAASVRARLTFVKNSDC